MGALPDHSARLLPADHATEAAYSAVSRWLSRGKTWLKFSAPYLASAGPGYEGVQELARDLVETAPDRIVWRSDWPHPTERAGKTLPEASDILECLFKWTSGDDQRVRILVRNPAQLYDFAP